MGTEHDGNYNVSKWKAHIFNPEFMDFPCVTALLLGFFGDPFLTISSTSLLADHSQIYPHSSDRVCITRKEKLCFKTKSKFSLKVPPTCKAS